MELHPRMIPLTYGIMGKGKMWRGHLRAFTVPLSLARLLPKSSLCPVPSVRPILVSYSFCRHTHHSSWPISSSLSPSLSLRDDWRSASHLNSGVFMYAGETEETKGLSLAQQRQAQSQAGLWRPSLGGKSSESWGYLSRGLNEVRMDSHTEIWDEDILGRRNSKHKGLEPGRP